MKQFMNVNTYNRSTYKMTQKYKAVCLFFKYSYVKHRDVVGGGGTLLFITTRSSLYEQKPGQPGILIKAFAKLIQSSIFHLFNPFPL